jgi:hypothetical protein
MKCGLKERFHLWALFRNQRANDGLRGSPFNGKWRLTLVSFGRIFRGALLGASVLSFSAAGASAAVVCSADECWHTHEVYEYPSDAHVIVHPDDWRWGESEHYRWHEHEGHGFWHGGEWRDF